MKIILAGKNNIAINVVEYITEHFPQHEIFSVVNKTDKGIA